MNDFTARIIDWGPIRANDFLYGTEITRLPKTGSLKLENELMPSGKIIHEWSSRVNYQEAREVAQLPTLLANQQYGLKLFAETTPAHSVMVKIQYFDHHNDLIEEAIFKDKILYFTLPERCVYYKISLLNAGNTSLIFDHLLLFDGQEDSMDVDDYFMSSIENVEDGNGIINAIIVEPDIKGIMSIAPQMYAHIPNVCKIFNLHKEQVSTSLLQAFKENILNNPTVKKVNLITLTGKGKLVADELLEMCAQNKVTAAIFQCHSEMDESTLINQLDPLLQPIIDPAYQLKNLDLDSLLGESNEYHETTEI